MYHLKLACLILFLILGASLLAAKYQDAVTCKDGSVYTGEIIGNVINKYVAIKTESGIKQINYAEIISIDKVPKTGRHKKNPLNLGISAGLFLPNKTVKDDYGISVSPALYAGITIPTKTLGIESNNSVEIDFSAEFYGRAKKYSDFSDGVFLHSEIEANIVIMPITVNTILNLQDKPHDDFYPFLGFGSGFYIGYEYVSQVIETDETHPHFVSDNGKNYNYSSIGFQALAGVQYKNLFSAAKFAIAPGNSEPDFIGRTDKALGGVTLMLGLEY